MAPRRERCGSRSTPRSDPTRSVTTGRSRAADAVAASRPRIVGVGAFPSARRARVVWAGLDDRSGRMAGLAFAIDAALAAEFRPESRPFRAHLTVARSDPPLELPETFGATA